MKDNDITVSEIDSLYKKVNGDAEASGYHLNPDLEFTKDLIKGLIVNERRYGYQSCPCRLSSGNKKDDLDIICPCDYRDPDLTDYDACYCALYVSGAVLKGQKQARSIPERRPSLAVRKKAGSTGASAPAKEKAKSSTGASVGSAGASAPAKRGVKKGGLNVAEIPMPVWRCKVCGYLCAREQPPEVCPICKAQKERFETFLKPTV